MDEIGELIRVAHEEHGRVVAHQIPVAFLGIELDRKASHIALGVGSPELAGDGREPQDQGRLGAGLQCLRLGVFRDVAGDRKSTRLNSSHLVISYAVFCLKKKKKNKAKRQYSNILKRNYDAK